LTSFHVFQSLYADHAQVARAVQHPSVAYVSFTGSVAGGRAVYKAAASAQTHTFIDVGLELGGKDATYVAADADIIAAADSLVDGAMYNAGQV
jgi:acyl-CoA reductase-like NAD-dependent aldehyde dehydrogenase